MATTDPFAGALDAIFHAPGSSDAHYWTAADQVERAVRVIRSQPDQTAAFGDGRIVQATHLIEFRRAEVACPTGDDYVLIDGERFAVLGDPQLDVEGLTWTAGIVPA